MKSFKPAYVRSLSSFRREAASAIKGHWCISMLILLLLALIMILPIAAAVFRTPPSVSMMEATLGIGNVCTIIVQTVKRYCTIFERACNVPLSYKRAWTTGRLSRRLGMRAA